MLCNQEARLPCLLRRKLLAVQKVVTTLSAAVVALRLPLPSVRLRLRRERLLPVRLLGLRLLGLLDRN